MLLILVNINSTDNIKMAIQYVNIRYILDRIMQHPLLQDINLEQAIDMTISFIRIVGVPNMFIEKTESIILQDYRGLLPSDFHSMIQVELKGDNKKFIYSVDSFHMNLDGHCQELTYKLQGGLIYTSCKEGTLNIAYLAINVDDCGYPLLPDNSSFIRALEVYIKKQWFTILFDLGKISPAVLQNTQQEYAWAVGDCESEFKRLTIDQMESLGRTWRSLLERPLEHREGLKNLNI